MHRNRFIAMAMSLMFATLAGAEVRISMSEAMKAATAKTQPAYSPLARQMKVAGKVEVEATVDTSGNVESVKAVSGNPLLTQSAVVAVEKWKFTPFTSDGKAVKAIVTLNFDFKP